MRTDSIPDLQDNPGRQNEGPYVRILCKNLQTAVEMLFIHPKYIYQRPLICLLLLYVTGTGLQPRQTKYMPSEISHSLISVTGYGLLLCNLEHTRLPC